MLLKLIHYPNMYDQEGGHLVVDSNWGTSIRFDSWHSKAGRAAMLPPLIDEILTFHAFRDQLPILFWPCCSKIWKNHMYNLGIQIRNSKIDKNIVALSIALCLEMHSRKRINTLLRNHSKAFSCLLGLRFTKKIN